MKENNSQSLKIADQRLEWLSSKIASNFLQMLIKTSPLFPVICITKKVYVLLCFLAYWVQQLHWQLPAINTSSRVAKCPVPSCTGTSPSWASSPVPLWHFLRSPVIHRLPVFLQAAVVPGFTWNEILPLLSLSTWSRHTFQCKVKKWA